MGKTKGRQVSASQSNLPMWLQRKLNSPPKAGFGVHVWLWSTARYLHRFCEPREIENLLAEKVIGVGRLVTAKEIKAAVQSAAKTVFKPR